MGREARRHLVVLVVVPRLAVERLVAPVVTVALLAGVDQAVLLPEALLLRGDLDQLLGDDALVRIRQFELVVSGRVARREEVELAHLHLEALALGIRQFGHDERTPVVEVDHARHEQRHRVHARHRVREHRGQRSCEARREEPLLRCELHQAVALVGHVLVAHHTRERFEHRLVNHLLHARDALGRLVPQPQHPLLGEAVVLARPDLAFRRLGKLELLAVQRLVLPVLAHLPPRQLHQLVADGSLVRIGQVADVPPAWLRRVKEVLGRLRRAKHQHMREGMRGAVRRRAVRRAGRGCGADVWCRTQSSASPRGTARASSRC